MATLGELLFYVATQQQDSGAASVADTSEAWGITSGTIQAVTRLLRPNEDEVCQHYAIKTIENICSQGGEWACKFAQQVCASLAGLPHQGYVQPSVFAAFRLYWIVHTGLSSPHKLAVICQLLPLQSQNWTWPAA